MNNYSQQFLQFFVIVGQGQIRSRLRGRVAQPHGMNIAGYNKRIGFAFFSSELTVVSKVFGKQFSNIHASFGSLSFVFVAATVFQMLPK